jgi:putative endopeptidase
MIKKIFKASSFALFLALMLGNNNNINAQKALVKPGINVGLMDKTVKPGDDFFRFVNGTWYDKTAIPADKTRWGSFDELRQNTDKDALRLIKN